MKTKIIILILLELPHRVFCQNTVIYSENLENATLIKQLKASQMQGASKTIKECTN